MHLDHGFSTDTRELFRYHQYCFICGSNGNGRGGLEIHHVSGRKKNENYLDSVFNASVLCHTCHESIQHDVETRVYLFKATMSVLKQEQYVATERDVLFLYEHSQDKYGKTVKEMVNLM